MRSHLCFTRGALLTLVLAIPARAQHASIANDGASTVTLFVRPVSASSTRIEYPQNITQTRRVETLVRNRLTADSVSRVKPNRGLGAVIGGGIGLIVGGVYGYHKGDERVPFDQATGAALYGGVGALIGAIFGAVNAPRVP